MIPTILLGMLAAALAWLQFFKKSHLTWKVGGWIFLAISVTSFWAAWDRHVAEQKLAKALARNASHIIWRESPLSVHLLGESGSPTQEDVAAHVKIFSRSLVRLSPPIRWEDIVSECSWQDKGRLGELSAARSESLYRSFQGNDGSIYEAVEDEAGIESLYYASSMSSDLKPRPIGNSLYLEYLSGIEVGNSNFTALQDLNESVLVVYVRSSNKEPPASLSWSIKNSAGHFLLRFEFEQREIDRRSKPARFAGVCIPKKYFGSASEI